MEETHPAGTRVHLIFSDGRGKLALEDRYQVYGIALLPFSLNIPPDLVDFTVNPILVQDPDAVCASANELAQIRADDQPYFPAGYHEYFTKVCQRASGVDVIWDVADCGIRVITGYGLPHKKCGKLFVDGKEVLFQELGDNPASVLTVFDFCNSQFAVAALGGHYLNHNPKTATDDHKKNWGRKLRKRKEYVKNCQAFFACDNSDMTWAFRVAESLCPESPQDFSCMSKPFGDAVVLSVLCAVNTWKKRGGSGPLDDHFKAHLEAIHTDFLIDAPSPVSRLTKLEGLLKSGIVSINDDAFSCKLFENSNCWFFTTERLPSKPTFEDGMEEVLIQFIVSNLSVWHKANGNDPGEECQDSVEAWRILTNMFGRSLQSIRLEENDNNGILACSQDGTSIQVWAETCRDLPSILKQVQNLLASGSVFDETDSGSETSLENE